MSDTFQTSASAILPLRYWYLVELSVTTRSVSNYLTDIDKRLREERKQKIFDMWMSCYSQEEIAATVELSRQAIDKEIKTYAISGSLSEGGESRDFSQDADYAPPHFNIWTFGKKTNGVSHFGNSEQRIVDNLLYLYTEPFNKSYEGTISYRNTNATSLYRGRVCDILKGNLARVLYHYPCVELISY